MSQKEQYPVGSKVVSLRTIDGFIHNGDEYGYIPVNAEGKVIYHTEDDGRAAFDFGHYGVHTFDYPENVVALKTNPADQVLTQDEIEKLKILYHREGYMIFILLDNCEARELFFNRECNIWFYVNDAPTIASVHSYDEPYAFQVDLAVTRHGDILVAKEVTDWGDTMSITHRL